MPDESTLRAKAREQAARDGGNLLVAGIRLGRQSRTCIEDSGNAIRRSQAQLIRSRARLLRSRRRLT